MAKPKSQARSWRDTSTQHLAYKGILTLARHEFHPPIGRDLSQNRLKRLMTPISAKDGDAEKKLAVEAFVLERDAIRKAELEVWTDGSVGEIPSEFVRNLQHGERVSVKWDEGWYNATLELFHEAHQQKTAVSKFVTKHGKAPDIILSYDDGDEHAYTASPTVSKQRVILCDEDGDTLDMYRSIPVHVGGAGVLLMRGNETVKELAMTAGAVGSSFDAEVFAAVHAFQEALKLTFVPGSTIRWFTDSKSCIEAISGHARRYGEMIRQLWGLMEQLMSREIFIECIWIPSHCGISRNDAADDLARRGIWESNLLDHQAIPLTLEAARSIIKTSAKPGPVCIPTLPEELPIPHRRAEVILHQLIVGCSPMVAAFRHGCNTSYDPVCKACNSGPKETTEHLILRCGGRSVSRREFIGRVGNKTVEELCRERPLAILRFLNNEELLQNRSWRSPSV